MFGHRGLICLSLRRWLFVAAYTGFVASRLSFPLTPCLKTSQPEGKYWCVCVTPYWWGISMGWFYGAIRALQCSALANERHLMQPPRPLALIIGPQLLSRRDAFSSWAPLDREKIWNPGPGARRQLSWGISTLSQTQQTAKTKITTDRFCTSRHQSIRLSSKEF